MKINKIIQCNIPIPTIKDNCTQCNIRLPLVNFFLLIHNFDYVTPFPCCLACLFINHESLCISNNPQNNITRIALKILTRKIRPYETRY